MEVPDDASWLYNFPSLRFAVATPLVRGRPTPEFVSIVTFGPPGRKIGWRASRRV